ncbi:hypothetical protein NK6_5516 [Bradyrhizobium diazoefficiens]|uniref:Uncharacterized protein n=1 Tax=Bradyrhizobium diazoefficiens TaxID=1355477 RepID=A0A0E4FV93_9BRAD|nr:hypothetical protein NK6_5516 [Bradyrhizobium diazoefficiens]
MFAAAGTKQENVHRGLRIRGLLGAEVARIAAGLKGKRLALPVIPGRGEAASPESITTIVSMDSGLAPRGAPRNDGGERNASK